MTEQKDKVVQPETIKDVAVTPVDEQALYSDSTPSDNNQSTGSYSTTEKVLNSNTTIDKVPATDIQKSANYVAGSSGWIIRGDGTAEFQSVTVRGTIYATAGTIGGFSITTTYLEDVADSFGLSSVVSGGNDVRLWAGDTFANRATAPFRVYEDGSVVATALSVLKLDIPDTTTVASFHVDTSGNSWWGTNEATGYATAPAYVLNTGAGVFNNVTVRGAIYGTTFKYDVVSAVGGQLHVANADSLDSAMTALDASTLTTKGNTTFAVNDILLIRAVATGIQEEYLRVTNIGSAPTYTVTRDLAGTYAANSNPAWPAGTAVTVIGSSNGVATYSGGWLRMLGAGTNAPYYSVFARTGVLYNAYAERCRLGNLNGVGGKTADCYGVYLGNSTTGNYLIYDDVSGNLIVNDSVLSNQYAFGDGSDGDVTISANTQLTADMYYDNLTINTGKILFPAGFRIFVKNTLTFEGTGKISMSGGVGGNGGDASGGASGTAGAAGLAAFTAAGSLPGAYDGKIGGAGGSPSYGSCGTVGNGVAGTDVTKGLIAGSASAGGAGGNGGGGCTVPGTSGAGGANAGTVFNKPRNLVSAYNFFDIYPAFTIFACGPGAGSGGGGSAGATSLGYNGGGGGGGGGSGSCGGIVWIAAKKIITVDGNNYVESYGAVGGNGGKGGEITVNYAGGGGGGGAGGNGGVIVLIYSIKSGTGVATCGFGAGGTGGAAGGTGATAGANGADGKTGSIFYIKI